MNASEVLIVVALSGVGIFVVLAMWSWVLKTKKKPVTSITSSVNKEEKK